MCVCAVFPRVVQLQDWVQAVADRHSTSEQPGGALPSSELPHTGKLQVSEFVNGWGCSCLRLCVSAAVCLSKCVWVSRWLGPVCVG